MAVWVDKAVRVHEAEILRLVVSRAAGSESFGDEAVDLFAVFATERKQHLDGLARVADIFGREVPKPGVRKQHERDRVADGEAPAGVAGELRIGREAECREEGYGPRQVGNRKVDEDLSAHEFVLVFCDPRCALLSSPDPVS